MSQYRSPLNFNQAALDGAKNGTVRANWTFHSFSFFCSSGLFDSCAVPLASPPALKKLDRFRGLILEAAAAAGPGAGPGAGGGAEGAVRGACTTALEGLAAAMNDDLNTPRAGAALFGLLKAVDAASVGPAAAEEVAAALEAFNAVLGVFYSLPAGYLGSGGGEAAPTSVPPDILRLVEERTKAKAAKDWAAADEIRAKITALGFEVKDSKEGAVVSPL